MVKQFEIAGASIPGTTHFKQGKNNQDFFYWLQTDDYVVALVSDGCGSTKYSEVGSRLLSMVFTNYLVKYLERNKTREGEKLFNSDRWWEEVRQDVLTRIRLIAQEMGEDWREILRDYFLATLVGVVIREDTTCIFSCGDGVVALNGEIQEIGPFEGNMPPYLVYGITGSTVTENDPSLLAIKRNTLFPTSEVQTLMIGTDGVGDLIKVAKQPFPAQEKLIGGIEQFWSEDRYFENPARMQNVFNVINTEKRRVDWKAQNIQRFPGLLPDDTTLITLRGKEGVK
ncbi:MAG: protein phosphatase 2C domain-containing protein [Candidatus Peribacteria bacterium]|nr:protein phosphatase 2C domain-containing protein [Candidatus Peribacteria bacterium]